MDKWPEENVLNILDEIEKKASISGIKFRKHALSNPDEAVKKLTGKELSSGLRLNVVEYAPWFDQIALVPGLSPSEKFKAEIDEVAKKLFS